MTNDIAFKFNHQNYLLRTLRPGDPMPAWATHGWYTYETSENRVVGSLIQDPTEAFELDSEDIDENGNYRSPRHGFWLVAVGVVP